MKYLLTIGLLIVGLTLNAQEGLSDELMWVDEQIESIKPQREGISRAKVASLKDPIAFLSKVKATPKKAKKPNIGTKIAKGSKKGIKKPVVRKILKAIINKSALIDNKWYKVGDKVGVYTLNEVKPTSVQLGYKKQVLVLTTDSQNLNLKFKN